MLHREVFFRTVQRRRPVVDQASVTPARNRKVGVQPRSIDLGAENADMAQEVIDSRRGGGVSPERHRVVLSFDRGTLLVEGLRSRSGIAVPDLLLDPRVGRFRAPAHRYEALLSTLREAGLEVEDRVAPGHRPGVSLEMPILRGYQQDALIGWELAHRRGVVVLPTGAGKTRVAIAAIAHVSRPALVLVPTRVLLEQWQSVLAQLGCLRVGQLGDGQRRIEVLTVATFESALRRMDQIGNRFDLLVVDEAHHFVGGKRIEALEMSTAPMRLGLTATPPEDPLEQGHLRDVLGPIVCRRSIVELAGTHLASFEHVRIDVDLTPSERLTYQDTYGPFIELYRGLRASGLAPTWAAFMQAAAATAEGRRALSGFHAARKLVSTASRKLAAVAELLARHHGHRILVFCADNAAAYAISREFLVPAITKDIRRPEREELLKRFRSGTIRTLVSARVLNEGVDIPEVGIGIIVGGVLGKREHVQRVGRLLRPSPGKKAIVYELVVQGTFEVRQSSTRRRALAA
jgi:superfamily II DNA or RNA helicase